MSQSANIFEQTTSKRRDKTLREFKDVLQNLIYLLRTAVDADTAYLYWINRSRQQFVKESQSTQLKDVHFEDRVSFENHYLNEYKDIKKPATLKQDQTTNIGSEGGDDDRVEKILLIPFVNNGETVAMTALEWSDQEQTGSSKTINRYTATLAKLLSTYLEITNLYGAEQEWAAYDEQLSFIDHPGHSVALVDVMVEQLQNFVPNGSVSIFAHNAGSWSAILNSKTRLNPVPLGLSIEENTIAADALTAQNVEFSVHFNGNPKRISPREPITEGATMAIPLTVNRKIVALVIITDQDPLLFKETTKHKLKNIVRVTALEIQSRLNKSGETTFLSTDYQLTIPDVWEQTVDNELQRLKTEEARYYTWTGFVTLSTLAELRTRLRAEELNHMQKDVIKAVHPVNYGLSGLVGFHANHQYFVMIQSSNSNELDRWKQLINEKFEKPLMLSTGKQITSTVETGFVQLDASIEDSYEVIQRCKRALNKKSSNPV